MEHRINSDAARPRTAVWFGCTLVAALALWQRPAHAHKVKVFACAEGNVISGYVYFPGGGRAQGVKVLVLSPAGEKLGDLATNTAGEFSFTAATACDHNFVVDAGDGHRAECVVKAQELALATPALPPPGRIASAGPQAPSTAAPAPEAATAAYDAISAQLRSLHERVDQLEERLRFRDVLGGMGYILGVMGIVLYVKRRAIGGRGRERDAGSGREV